MDIATDIALERLVEAKGITLIVDGDVRVGRCPFGDHDDATLIIDAKANTWRCEAGCGGGGVVDWVAKVEGVSHTHAESLLKADFEPVDGAIVNQSTKAKLPALFEPGETDAVVLTKVVNFYHQVLLDSTDALAWLLDRGITDRGVITNFNFGLCDRTLGYRIPKANRKAGKLVRQQLKRLGILRNSGHEHFRGSLVVPIFDETGKVANIYGRKLRDDLRKGTDLEVVLTEDDAGVFNPEGFVEGQRLILTGSIIDALTWWSAGFWNVTATMGMNAIPTAVKALISAQQIRSVAIALDRDDGATDAIVGELGELGELGVEVHRVVFPVGLNANDIARKADNARDELEGLLKAANWISGSGSPSRAPTPSRPVQEPEEPIAKVNGEVVVVRGDRRWRVRGLEDITGHNTMRVNLWVANGETATFHVDVVELYSSRQRKTFLSAASSELDVEQRVLKKDLGHVLLHLEELVDAKLHDTLDGNASNNGPVILSQADREQALAFLRDPRLLERVVDDFDVLGVIGEKTNKLIAYLAAVSRKLSKPLAVVIQSSPAAGKSALLDAVLKLVPDEDTLVFSAITARSLFYLPSDGLSHKVLALAEEEGAGRAAYALKLLQSEGSLSIASTAKDLRSGRLTTQTYSVAGPVALLMTTTSLNVDEELLSRCIVLTADEGRDQTKAIHAEQRRRLSLNGLVGSRQIEQVVKTHNDAQRLLRPLRVVVPDGLDIDFATHRVRCRRDFTKVLGLVQAVALLRQHQRVIRETGNGVKYIEATEDDVAVATKLANDVMGKSLDEVPPGTRAFLMALRDHVVARCEAEGVDVSDVRFTRRELRETLGTWGDTRMKIHLARLVKLEYVLVHASRGVAGRRVFYELNWNGESDTTTEPVGPRSPHGRPSVAPRSPLGHEG